MRKCISLTCVLLIVSNCYSLNTLDLSRSLFPKCCGKGQQLKTDLKTCINITTEEVRFFPDDIVFLSSENLTSIPIVNDSNLLIGYNSRPNCNNAEIIPFTENVLLLNNGTLLLNENKVNFTFGSASYCMDRVFIDRSRPMYRTAPSDHTYVTLLCPCLNKFCVRKCCLGDRILNVRLLDGNIKAKCVAYSNSSEIWRPRLENNLEDYFTSHGLPSCPAGVYLLNKSSSKSSFQILRDGSVEFDEGTIPADEYCGDKSLFNEELMDNVLACLQPPPNRNKRDPLIYATFFAFGSMFLLATLLLHLWLPELRKSVHSCNLMMHVASLFMGYVALAVGNFELLQAPSVTCIVLAYIIQFSFLAAFFWLNVLCIDISWTFSGLHMLQGNNLPTKEQRKFILYSLYAWGSTAMISAVTILLEYGHILPHNSKLKPNFGERLCWFKNSESTVAYFYGPMGVLLICNLLLFIYTAIKINLARKDTSILQREGSYRHDGKGHVQEEQHRFLLYFKLFLLMGVTWTFEIVSWSIYQSDAIWYATDFINVLRGLFIFVLFCMKKKMFFLLKSKFSGKTDQPPMSLNNRSISRTTSIATQSTNSLQLSSLK